MKLLLEAPNDQAESHMALSKCTKELPVSSVGELLHQSFNSVFIPKKGIWQEDI